jgi:gliding motility-associated-like protein
MRNIFTIVITLFLLILPGILHAQYDNIWAFGTNAGIDFSSGTAVAITTAISTSEGSASVCDTTGHLRFYTDGTSVWDRNNNLMPNCTDLPDVGINITISTAQGALIVPMPGSTQKYYVFSLGKFEATADGYFGKLYYSLIDMSLNGGLGDVIPGEKGILMDSFLTEHMTAVSGNSCNIWLLVTSRVAPTFKAYEIDFNGINFTPVLSPRILPPAGASNDGNIGTIDVATDRSKIAITQSNLYIYDFDADSGKVKNPLLIDSTDGYYGVSFSPDNSKLYAGIAYPNKINQFDLSSGDSATMVNSKVLIATGQVFSGAIKRGPDNRIYYCSRANDSAINIINFPNLAGIACQNVTNGLPLVTGTNALFGLPNLAMIANKRKVRHTSTDTVYCYHAITLTATNTSGDDYVWENGSNDTSRIIQTTGDYWVSYHVISPCMYDEYSDTFHIIYDNTIKTISTTTGHTGYCKADSYLMKAANVFPTNYTWEDGSTDTQRYIYQTGTYWVSYQIDSICKHFTDTFKIVFPAEPYVVSFTTDTIVCVNDAIQLQNTSNAYYTSFNWSFGNGDTAVIANPVITYLHAGSYEVTLTAHINDLCFATSVKNIVVDSVYQDHFRMTTHAICTGRSIDFYPLISGTSTSLDLNFGDGDHYSFSNEQEITHAYADTGLLQVTLTAQYRACASNSFVDTVRIYPLPKVDLGADTGLCLHGAPIMLQNLFPAPAVSTHFLWNTGDTTAILKVVHPGIYSLTISTAPVGCATTEQITVRKDCYIDIPNAFTPNNDGNNDYFFPRQLLSKKITQFSMKILNRWGQIVFETTATNGRGWDGKMNEKEQPDGVYIYLIEAEIDSHGIEKYQGNVTLIR